MAEKAEYTAEEKMIEEKVMEILTNSDMDNTTEAKVRKLASEQLGLDLSQPNYKKFVRQVVNSFIIAQDEEENQNQQEVEKLVPEEEVAEEKKEVAVEKQERGERAKEYDDNGDLIICHLSVKRRVSWSEFKGRSFLSIREYYDKNGKELPSAKGIALSAEQWARLKENVPAIEEAIKKISSG
ncbi:RNA polymerase II transcriptional coactivator KELP [Heracleum sosnowskyi]|uniref:RNA polymerase II transcriptional coactivator KELP n=1 Tax=Heracleum sosnowskyi TaxID=360622 RepID=A0AAD8N7P0_9APIA|nr:RNA polymerase II transcriptional coactivator KELP [Heracleum sosnowskyi]